VTCLSVFLAPLFLLVPLAPLAAYAEPAIGASAPDFAFVGDGGVTYSSADYFGSTDAEKAGRGVVIAWFPKAFTSG
jgi:peroxiredoxin